MNHIAETRKRLKSSAFVGCQQRGSKKVADYAVNMTDTLNTNTEMPRPARFHFIKNDQHFQHAHSATTYFKLGGLIYFFFGANLFMLLLWIFFFFPKLRAPTYPPTTRDT